MNLDKFKRYLGLAVSLLPLLFVLPIAQPYPGPRLTPIDKTLASIIAMETTERVREWRRGIDFKDACGGQQKRGAFSAPSLYSYDNVPCDQIFSSVSFKTSVDLIYDGSFQPEDAKALANKLLEFSRSSSLKTAEASETAKVLAAVLNSKTLAWHAENESSLRTRVYLANGFALAMIVLLFLGRARVGGWIVGFFMALGRLLGLGGKVAKKLHEKV